MRLRTTGLTLLTLMLAACGGDDSSDAGGGGSTTPAATAKDIIVSPALGVVTQGVVKVHKLDGTLIVSGVTGVDGTVKVNIPAGIDAVVVEVTGSDATRYFDEATPDTLQPFPAGYSMRALSLVSVDKQPVAVTPLTEIAYRYAQTRLGTLNSLTILQANDFVESYFSVDNILMPPTPIDSLPDFAALQIDSLRNRNAAIYAMMLTSLTRMAASRTTADNSPALRVMDELAADLADGVLSNSAAATYPSNNMPNALKLAQNAHLTLLATNHVTLPEDLKNYLEQFQFRINSVYNNANPETPPTTGGGGGSSTPSVIRIIPNIGSDRVTALVGTYTGFDQDNKPCSVTVSGSGTITVFIEGNQVSSATLDGGPEDLLRQSFTGDAGDVLSSNLFMAKTSTAATLTTIFSTDGSNGARIAGELDEKAGKVNYACLIKAKSS